MEATGDQIAELVHSQFDGLPQKRKPQVRGDGVQEWVPLSGIVAQERDNLRCIALGTGMKCLPQDKIDQAQGVVLHDWHAEIVAIRSFNYFLLKECQALARSQDRKSVYLRRRTESEITDLHFQPFTLKDDVLLHMYCSEAPCGDASMELIIAAQEDPTPWTVPVPDPSSPSSPSQVQSVAPVALYGRSYFSHLGSVRRKPSRPDAPPTRSKSCSDKLALKQCTSLLSSIVSLLISPTNAYLSSLTLPESQFSTIACERAFGSNGRMASLKNYASSTSWPHATGYRFQPFALKKAQKEFIFSQRRKGATAQEKLVPSNLAAARTSYGEETLIGGVLQGRRQFDSRGASLLCRKRMWALAAEVATIVAVPALSRALSVGSYAALKADGLLDGRRMVKKEAKAEALKGWVGNDGDEAWGLDVGAE